MIWVRAFACPNSTQPNDGADLAFCDVHCPPTQMSPGIVTRSGNGNRCAPYAAAETSRVGFTPGFGIVGNCGGAAVAAATTSAKSPHVTIPPAARERIGIAFISRPPGCGAPARSSVGLNAQETRSGK